MFHFKQFSVDQSDCAMKINTDGVLLGALAEVNDACAILDIGTGTGVIALMLAQRFTNANIDAIEIDVNAAQTATRNFSKSPFKDRLTGYTGSFEFFFKQHPENKYDLVVSNPPFYIDALKSPRNIINLAKHATADFFEVLISNVAAHLAPNGVFCVVLPPPAASLVKQLANVYRLYPHKIISVYSFENDEPHREILFFGLNTAQHFAEDFVIYNAPKIYSAAYQALLKNFLTIF